MSMREYAVDTYGILLDDDLMKQLASKICDDYSDDDYEEDPYGFNEIVEEALTCVDYISNFTKVVAISIWKRATEMRTSSTNWNYALLSSMMFATSS